MSLTLHEILYIGHSLDNFVNGTTQISLQVKPQQLQIEETHIHVLLSN